MLRQSLKIIAAFWAVLFATVAVAGDGIRLSEWGDGQLTEISGQKAEVVGRDAPELRLGDFLVDEARSFGAGALDGEQLRKALANRAVGKDGAGIRDWMANRWESAPGRFGAHMAGYAEGQLESLSWVESADVRWTPSADDAFGAFSASGIGGLRTGEDSFFGIQPKIQRDNGDGKMSGSFGVFQRRAFGDWAVAGVNAFVDYADDPTYGEFARWSLGADFASSWVDGNASRYFSNEGRRVRIGDSFFQAYTPDGVSAELRVHSPGLNWLEGYATFAKWEGRGPNPDTINRAYGVSFAPRAGWKVDAETTDGNDFGARVAYAWTLGKESALATVEPFGVYTKLTDPAVRIDAMTITTFEVYEAAALYELQDSGISTLSAEELEKRISLSWLMVPEHLRISEEYRSKCVPPIFAVNNDFDSLVKWGTERAANNPGSWEYADEELSRKSYAHGAVLAGGIECFALMGGLKGTEIDLQGNYPLHNAVRFGGGYGVNVARMAILAGADVNVKYDPDLADDRRRSNDWEGDLEVYRGYTPLDIVQHRYSSYEVYTYDYWNGGYRSLTLDCDIVLGDWNDFYSATGLYSVQEWWRKSCLGALKIAEVLGKSGGECDVFETGPVCRIADDQTVVDWKPEMPPNGDLLDETISEVMPGYTGEVFRITATTAYADVDFTLFADSDALMVQRGGTIVSFNNSGANSYWYDEGFNTANGRINSGDETKVAIVELTSPMEVGDSVTATMEARFFYHVNKLNTVTLAFTLVALDQPPTALATITTYNPGVALTLSVGAAGATYHALEGNHPSVTVLSGGELSVTAPYLTVRTATIVAGAKVPGLTEVVRMTAELRTTLQLPATSEHHVVAGYEGVIFTVTLNSPGMWARADVNRVPNNFWVQTISPVEYAVHGRNLDWGWEAQDERLLHTSFKGYVSFSNEPFDYSKMNMAVSVRHAPTLVARQVDTNNSGNVHQLSDLSGATGVAVGTAGKLVPGTDGWIRLNSQLDFGEAATLTVDFTSPNFLGTERWTVAVTVPEFGVLPDGYTSCVRPPDVAAKRAESNCGAEYCAGLDNELQVALLTAQYANTEAGLKSRRDRVCHLIKIGADPNLPYPGTVPALHTAMSVGYLQIVRMLLVAGADPNFEVPGSSLLNSAASWADPIVGRALIDRGADVNHVTSGQFGYAPIHMLGRYGSGQESEKQAAFARLLIKATVDANKPDTNGRTYLWHLIDRSDSVASLEEFLKHTGEKRINPNLAVGGAYDGYDQSPLYNAVQDGRLEIANKLLDYADTTVPRLDVNKRDAASGQVHIHTVRDVELMRRLVITLSVDIDIDSDPFKDGYENGWRAMDFLARDDDGSDIYLQLGRIIWDAHDDSDEKPHCRNINLRRRLCKAATYD